MSLPFLLEIGVEEVPDWMIEPALASMRGSFTTLLSDNNLAGSVTRVDATPRRLVLFADGLPEAQADETRAIAGPPVKSGAGAAQGFAKKMGVQLAELQTVQTPKGEYYSFNKDVPGRRTADILTDALPSLISGIPFPKAMYWTGKGGPRFIRPIRWIVALLGNDVVPFEFAGVASGSTTDGHRVLGRPAIRVTIGDYEEQLRSSGVILSAEERRARIEEALGADVQRDDALLNTLVYLTEFPTPIRGRFSREYLQLPQEILTTVMRHHQRYFSVQSGGELAPEFVAVMNTDSDPEGLVREGNERVLRARFNDARFFWDVDQRRTLSSRVEDLKNVTFQAKLGTYFEKTGRMAEIARSIGAADGGDTEACARAAQLSKCDLTTEMVKEFTELQGVVGGLYAREQGEQEQVWKAIYDHYRPLSMEDAIPSTLTGLVVSLADKIDTLRGCFGIGLMPTGSRDPFALRRAAQGVIRILVEGELNLKLPELIGDDAQLQEFMLDRARYYFRDVRGFRYDEVNAVLAVQKANPHDALLRLEAIRAVRPTQNFEPLAASFKRIQNILRQADFTTEGRPEEALLVEEPEKDLLGAMKAVKLRTGVAGYEQALTEIASLRPAVDKFFDKVLVNAPDERVRHNRLLLLSNLFYEFSTIADFSEIVVTA